jgi:multicomponent K+:H+ antiporter subunit E
VTKRIGKTPLLPSPLLSLALFVTWLMLNESTSAGHVLLGAALALLLPLIVRRLRVAPPALRHPWAALRLAAVVAKDMVTSNLAVARLVLGDERRITPRWVRVPLSLRDPHAIVALAGIVTMTPGTLSARLGDDRRHLLLHAFDVDDDDAAASLVDSIKRRYEAPLARIFEGGNEAS